MNIKNIYIPRSPGGPSPFPIGSIKTECGICAYGNSSVILPLLSPFSWSGGLFLMKIFLLVIIARTLEREKRSSIK
jgi:hypothetical protein